MGAAVGGTKGGIKSDINVTPLVDIVLVLLIIFIVITPAVNDSVKLPLAKHSPKIQKNSDTKYLTVFYNAKRDDQGKVIGPGAVTIDDKDAKGISFNLEDEASELKFVDYVNKAMSSQGGDNRVFVKADSELPFKHINKLFQSCRKGGADEAQIVTGEDKANKEGGK